MTIPFRIRQIKTQQFAMFPDLLVNGEEVTVESEFGFGVNNDATDIRCVAKISYIQKDKLLLTTEVHCFFEVSSEGSQEIAKQHRIEVGFLRYLATISTGTVRGIIHTKTENTVLNTVVLPPINLIEAIKEDFVFQTTK
jgi:hypothetical protein